MHGTAVAARAAGTANSNAMAGTRAQPPPAVQIADEGRAKRVPE